MAFIKNKRKKHSERFFSLALKSSQNIITHPHLHRLHRLVRAGDDWQAGVYGRLPRLHLVPHLGHDGGGGADEADASGLARVGEVGPFGEEAVARVDGVDVVRLGKRRWRC